MKRVLAATLALTMTLSFGGSALAAEEPTVDYDALQSQVDAIYAQIDALYEEVAPMEDRLAERYIHYYELYGDMYDWDEETWNLSDSWTNAEWDGYYLGEELALENYDYLSETKAEMGMYYPHGINVRINGVYLDTAPIAVAGVTYLPAEILLAALGLETTQVETVDLDGDLCLPIRAVAEAAGYEVDWDSHYEVVSVENWEQVAAAIDEEFTILNTILKASLNTVDPAKVYESKSKVTYKATLYGEEKHDTASITVDMDGLVQGDYSALSADYSISTDLDDIEDLIAEFGGQETLDVVEALNGDVSIAMDGGNGGIYFKSDMWSDLGAYYLPENKWIGMEDAEFGAVYTDLMAGLQDMTVGSLLVSMAKESYHPYETLDSAVTAMKLLFADDAFTTSGSGSTKTYTSKMTMVKLVTRAAALGLFTADDLSDLFGDTGIPTASYQLTAKVSGDKLTSFTLKGALDWSAISVEFDIDSTATKGEGYVAIKGRYIGKLEMFLDSSVKAVSKTVQIPTEYLDHDALMEKYYQDIYGW